MIRLNNDFTKNTYWDKERKNVQIRCLEIFLWNSGFGILNEFLHDDFMLIENFTMTVKEDALKMFQELIDSNFKPSNGIIIAETDNLLAVEYIHEQNGEKIRHTMVQLWKDGKAWREIDTEEKVND